MNNSIIGLRGEVDKIDDEIFELFDKRFEIVKKIFDEKKKSSFEIEDLDREREIVNDKIKRFRFSDEFVRNLYDLIFKESKKLQEKND